MFNRTFIALILAGLTFFLAGCENYSADYYSSGEVGRSTKVYYGKITAMRSVTIKGSNSIGAVAGAVAGGAGGSTLGSSTAANVAGAAGGAVVGGLIGGAVQQAITTQKGVRYTVRLSSGKSMSVVQGTKPYMHVGQQVKVLYGSKTRIVPR